MVTKIRKIVIFGSYLWATTLAGLLLHPYKSVKEMVIREHILLPITLSPLIGLGGLFLIGRIGSRILNLQGLGRELIAAMLGTTLIGLLLWQGLLLILIWRFSRMRE